jgi:hypothetical protein
MGYVVLPLDWPCDRCGSDAPVHHSEIELGSPLRTRRFCRLCRRQLAGLGRFGSWPGSGQAQQLGFGLESFRRQHGAERANR